MIVSSGQSRADAQTVSCTCLLFRVSGVQSVRWTEYLVRRLSGEQRRELHTAQALSFSIFLHCIATLQLAAHFPAAVHSNMNCHQLQSPRNCIIRARLSMFCFFGTGRHNKDRPYECSKIQFIAMQKKINFSSRGCYLE